MPRPKKQRLIQMKPEAVQFKPRGVPLSLLSQIQLAIDEVEALRLADFEKLSQEQAAERMGVSRATFGRIVAAARGKTADALVNGKAIIIERNPIDECSRTKSAN